MSERASSPPWLAWVWWCVVVFGVLGFAATSHDEANRVFAAFDQGSWTWTPGNTVRALRVYLTNERDAQRYLAYDNAWLGRPYQPYFVRPLAAWSGDEVPSDVFIDTDAPPIRARRSLIPYRDFLVEYPPGFFLWTMPPALMAASLDGYRLAFTLWMALCATAGLVMCTWLARRPAFAAARPRLVVTTALATLAIGVVVTHRYDASVALLLCVAVWGALERRPLALGIALGLAAATKVIPVLVAPPLAMWLWQERRRRELVVASAAATATVLVVAAPFLLLAGRALYQSGSYHFARPLQIESTAAALVALFARRSLVVVQSYGSVNVIGAPASRASACASVAAPLAIAASYLWAWWRLRSARGAEAERLLLAAMLAPLVAFMATAKVFSPQYLVWILPLATLLSLARGGASVWLWLAICVATQVIYPAAYPALLGLDGWMCALVVVRNLAVVGWLVAVARAP